jgi:hypothetical protein
MKIFLSRTLLSGCISMLVMAAGTQSLSADELNVLGSLQARGRIQVSTDNGPAPVNLADTTFAYVAGDTINTGKGTGLLKINGLGRIGLAPDTEASVVQANNSVSVNLNRGAIAYTLTPGSDFTVRVAGMTVRPTRSPIQQVSAGVEEHVTGWILIGEAGKVEVGSQSGRIEISQQGSMQVVETGQMSVVQFQGGKLIATQAGGAGAGASAGAGAAGGSGITLLQILAIAAVVGGITAGIVLSEDDDEVPPASP